MALSTVTRHRATLVLTSSDGEREMLAVDMAQIPIPQAATASGLPESILRHLIDAGVLNGGRELVDLDQATEIAGQLAAARAPVEGQPILATDAAEKYGFDVNSVYKWHRDGWVTVLEDKLRGKLYNEGDISFARAIADIVGHTPGRAVFPAKPRSGRPKKAG